MLTHIDNEGKVKMVNVAEKEVSERVATATAKITMKKEVLNIVKEGTLKKGDALGTAKIAAIMAAKNTASVIPLCHNIFLNGVDIRFEFGENHITIIGVVSASAKTGVEMEALNAVTVGALVIYDMAKALDKEMIISDIMLLEKQGGKSGHFIRSK